MDSSDEEAQIKELNEIKQYVENEKKKGNRMFVSGWDDDCDNIEPETNPHSKLEKLLRQFVYNLRFRKQKH